MMSFTVLPARSALESAHKLNCERFNAYVDRALIIWRIQVFGVQLVLTLSILSRSEVEVFSRQRG